MLSLVTTSFKFQFIKGINNILEDALSHLTDLDVTKTNSPMEEGHEYVYTVFEPLPDNNVKWVFYDLP